ncbi:MAG: riboflavin synthase [Gallionella sp.]|nr:riboflavin synthase [Gallionella sp.]MDD4959213.1 riboflavin synthase [Gallionella sp.]
MFSGIISDIGCIAQVADRDGGLRLEIATHALDLSDVNLGDSIAVNGVCLTVIAQTPNSFAVDVSQETLACTVGLGAKDAPVNLEKALCLADRLGGHLVSGHVDGVGEVLEFTDLGESWKLVVNAPQALAKFIAVKGSITINGVSLTINQVAGSVFHVNLIPHTLAMTNLKQLSAGSRVNLEVDLIARYVERMMQKEVL